MEDELRQIINGIRTRLGNKEYPCLLKKGDKDNEIIVNCGADPMKAFDMTSHIRADQGFEELMCSQKAACILKKCPTYTGTDTYKLKIVW